MTDTPTTDDAKTAGYALFCMEKDQQWWKDLSPASRKHYEDLAQGAIDHWRRNVVVTDEMLDAALKKWFEWDHLRPSMRAAIKAALGAGK